MKYLVFLFFCILSLGGCSKDPASCRESSAFESWMADNGKIKVLSTTGMIDDLVREIGRERVDHLALIVGEIDPHSYELVKGDDEKLSSAQIIFFNGLGLEHGASLRYRLENHAHAVALGEEIRKQCPTCIIKVEKAFDPHVWMDISLWSLAIDPIVAALAEADPEYAEFYRRNGRELHSEMERVDKQVYEELQKIPSNKRFLVTSHDAFNYFARRYLANDEERANGTWKKRFDAPEGLAPEGQLSSKDIQHIIDHLCQYQIGVLFPESNVSRDSLRKIASACLEKGIKIKISQEVLYGDAEGPLGSDADSYLKMMVHNGHVLESEWAHE